MTDDLSFDHTFVADVAAIRDRYTASGQTLADGDPAFVAGYLQSIRDTIDMVTNLDELIGAAMVKAYPDAMRDTDDDTDDYPWTLENLPDDDSGSQEEDIVAMDSEYAITEDIPEPDDDLDDEDIWDWDDARCGPCERGWAEPKAVDSESASWK